MAESSKLVVATDLPLPANVESLLTEHVSLVPLDGPANESVSGIFTYGHPIVDAQTLDLFPNTRVVSNHGVGVDHIDVQACRAKGIPVGNTPGVLDGATADLAFGLLMATARNIVQSANFARLESTTKFDQSMFHGREIHDSTLGIIGLGRIGQQIARRASGFDMKILYHNRKRNSEAEDRLNATYLGLPELLQQSDFVVVSTPLTNETVDLISREQLLLMQSDAVLINIARGPIVNTNDLVAVLQEGHLFAVGLDVTDPEPLPRHHPLLNMDNVIVTSHIGSASQKTRQKMVDLAITNLLLGLQDKPLQHDAAAD